MGHEMKIPAEHFKTLEDACNAVLAANPGITLESYEAQSLSPMRFNFDVFYAAKINGGSASKWACDVLYPLGMNDTHIGTALKRILGNKGESSKQRAKQKDTALKSEYYQRAGLVG